MTTVACDFDLTTTTRITHYTYSVGRVILNTSVQIVIHLYSETNPRFLQQINYVIEGEDYLKWTDDSYITEMVEKRIALFMPPPPPPQIPEEEIKEEPKVEEPTVEEPKVEEPKVEEDIVEPPTPKAREEIILEEPPKKVVAKKRCSKKATPSIPIAVMT